MTDATSPPFAAGGLVPAPTPADAPRTPRQGLRDVPADPRAHDRDFFASARRGAPGEIAWGRFVDVSV